MYTFNERCAESSRVLRKYPDRVPVICERSQKNKNVSEIDKNKYLVPSDLTMSQYIYVIRKRLVLPAEKAIFLFINNTLVSNTRPIGDIYDEHRDPDGFLYILYSDENTFGSTPLP